MAKYFIVRQELAANALAAISSIYASMLVDVQAVKDGDGKVLAAINWGAHTPQFEPRASGYLPQWSHQDIILELRASVDYRDRSLSPRYLKLLQVFEDFCARTDLCSLLSSQGAEGIVVESPPTFDGGSEDIQESMFVTVYRLRVTARGKVNGG